MGTSTGTFKAFGDIKGHGITADKLIALVKSEFNGIAALISRTIGDVDDGKDTILRANLNNSAQVMIGRMEDELNRWLTYADDVWTLNTLLAETQAMIGTNPKELEWWKTNVQGDSSFFYPIYDATKASDLTARITLLEQKSLMLEYANAAARAEQLRQKLLATGIVDADIATTLDSFIQSAAIPPFEQLNVEGAANLYTANATVQEANRQWSQAAALTLVYNKPISEFNITATAVEALEAVGIKYIGQLIQLQEGDLIMRVGAANVASIVDGLKGYDMHLNTDIFGWNPPPADTLTNSVKKFFFDERVTSIKNVNTEALAKLENNKIEFVGNLVSNPSDYIIQLIGISDTEALGNELKAHGMHFFMDVGNWNPPAPEHPAPDNASVDSDNNEVQQMEPLPPESFYDFSVDVLAFELRQEHIEKLKAGGIQYIGQLASKSYPEIRDLLGVAGMKLLEKSLAVRHIVFTDDIGDWKPPVKIEAASDEIRM